MSYEAESPPEAPSHGRGAGTVVVAAAEAVLHHGIRSGRSAFEPALAAWTPTASGELVTHFAENPDPSSDDFLMKLERQLANVSDEAIVLAAELLYLNMMPLIPTLIGPERKRAIIRKVLSWAHAEVSIPGELDAALSGFLPGGQAFLNYRWAQLAFLIRFVNAVTGTPSADRERLLDDPWAFRDLAEQVLPDHDGGHRARAQFHVLLFLAFPQTYEPIASVEHKQAIIAAFGGHLPNPTGDLDRDLLEIRGSLQQDSDATVNFYSEPWISRWRTTRSQKDTAGSGIQETDEKRVKTRLLTDDPVGLKGDKLERRDVARALQSQLQELVKTYPGRSFLVHIDGAWGTGKSTLLHFLRELAEQKQPKAANGRAAPPATDAATLETDDTADTADHNDHLEWLVIPYDAWRQSRAGPPWLTVLHAVRKGVRPARHTWLRRAGFWFRERARLVSFWQWIASFLLVAGAAAVLVTFLLRDGGLAFARSGDLVRLLGGLATVGTAAWVIAASFGRFIALDSRRAARTFTETRADPMEDLARHFTWMLRQSDKPILLLIDDLDRCHESFVIELLDAVQKLMRDRDASDRAVPNLVVVVAADGRWIRQSYDAAYASLAPAVREPGATIGSVFIEKLFQLTVPVPQLSGDLKAEFLIRLLAEPSSEVDQPPDPDLAQRLREAPRNEVLGVLASAPPIERIRAAGVAIDRLVVEPEAQQETRHALEAYAPLLDPTPRAMKRFIMAYSMLRTVRLAEGSVVRIGPLALWTIVRTRWPLLAEYLNDLPNAVRLFQRPSGDLPASVPTEVAALFTDPPEDLRNVMNHPDGPLTAEAIRECCGQAIPAPAIPPSATDGDSHL